MSSFTEQAILKVSPKMLTLRKDKKFSLGVEKMTQTALEDSLTDSNVICMLRSKLVASPPL